MKMLKLLVTLGLLFVAHATYATGATATSAITCGGTNGQFAILVAMGDNGTYSQSDSLSPSGNCSTIESVDHINTLLEMTLSNAQCTMNASCYITIPDNATATVSYKAERAASSGVYYGTAYVVVGTSTFTASTTLNGSVTLNPGTYHLQSYCAGTSTVGGQSASMTVTVNYDE